MFAEAAYLFRHALLRDAAYQLQLPADRAALHALALEIIEGLYGGRALQIPVADEPGTAEAWHHPTDAAALELARHAAAAMRLSPCFEHLLALRRHYLSRAAMSASVHLQCAQAAELWLELAEISQGPARAEALRSAADEKGALGRRDEAMALLKDARALADDFCEPLLENKILGQMGAQFIEAGKFDDARSMFNVALGAFERLGAKPQVAVTRLNLASLEMSLGNLEACRSHVIGAEEIARTLGLEKLLAEAASFRASLCQLAGEFEQAQHLYAQALEIHRRRNNHIFTCATLGNMAATSLEMNQFDLAEARFGQVLSLASEAGLRRTLGIALGNYAILLSRRRRFDEAISHFQRALAVHREIGNVRSEGVALGNLAETLLCVSRAAEAAPYFDAAVALHRRLNNRPHLAGHLCGQARCLLALSQRERAEAQWREGIQMLASDSLALEREVQQQRMLEDCRKLGVAPLGEG
ncbi:MAG: tetratricopeptide repeat protein [Planctomycetes bacterium]|nr:tetratricopeptide repeat protein [Planctomycetota bacterium]